MISRSGRKYLVGAAALAVLAAPVSAAPDKSRQASIIVRGGAIYDGASTKPVIGDVVVVGDRIVYVGPTKRNPYKKAARIIDATGKVVAPGFIDPHSHADRWLQSLEHDKRLLEPLIRQGVTTVFTGSDGYGQPDSNVAGYLAGLSKAPIGVNVGTFVGFAAVRKAVLGEDDRAPSPAELQTQKQLVAKGMCDGAFGLSTGLFYVPQSFAKIDEVIEVTKEAASRGGVYDTHQRSESTMSIGLIASMKEVIEIGRQARIPIHYSHLKAAGGARGSAAEMIEMIEAARAEGLSVTANQYPYEASNTSLSAASIPHWAMDGGLSALTKRAADPATRAKIIGDMRELRGDPSERMIISAGQPWSGQRLDAIARGMGLSAEEAALKIVLETQGRTASITFGMARADIKQLMRQPWMMTGSDGGPGAHPRFYGAFAQKYAQYVVDEKAITLPEFINSSTGRTADFFGIEYRGRLKPGWFADVVVFDPVAYRARATFLEPALTAEGVQTVLVNGVAQIDDGEVTGKGAGRPLRHISTPGSCPVG